ncbi:MAG TPA: hypothetical protein VGK73_40065 [Polyangiaceae bacterium]
MVTRQRLKAYLTLVGTFLLGAVCAGAGYHAYAKQESAALFAGDREAFEARRVQMLSRELDLRGEQEAQVREIFRKHAPERQRLMRETMQGCGATMEAHRERVDAEIRALLDPAQRGRFDAWRAERRKQLFAAPDPAAKRP